MIVDAINSTYKPGTRLHSVDICRGLALLLMVEAHIPRPAGWISGWSGILAAPFFLIISGLSYDLFLSSRAKTEAKKNIFLESVFRGFLVYTIPLIPYIIVSLFFLSYSSVITENSHKIDIFHWAVFQIIGAGYIFGSLIPNNLKSKTLITISTFILTYITANSFHETLYFLLTGDFPLLPWIAYFLFGRVAYGLYQNKHLKNDKNLLSFSIIFLIVSSLIFEASGVKFSPSTRDQFPMFLLISGTHLFVFSSLVTYIDHKHTHLSLMSPLEKVGKICFTAYYIHLLILLTIQKSASILFDNFPPAISNIITFVIITTTLVQIEKSWKNYNYIFGFEWLIRKGTDSLLKLCKM